MVPVTRGRRARARRPGAAWRDERGQALVETALVLPILLVLLVGLMEFARVWNVYHVMNGVAREAARSAVVANQAITEDSVRTAIRSALRTAALDPARVTILLTGVEAPTGTPTRVELRYTHRLIAPSLFGALPSTIPLFAAVVMRNE